MLGMLLCLFCVLMAFVSLVFPGDINRSLLFMILAHIVWIGNNPNDKNGRNNCGATEAMPIIESYKNLVHSLKVTINIQAGIIEGLRAKVKKGVCRDQKTV